MTDLVEVRGNPSPSGYRTSCNFAIPHPQRHPSKSSGNKRNARVTRTWRKEHQLSPSRNKPKRRGKRRRRLRRRWLDSPQRTTWWSDLNLLSTIVVSEDNATTSSAIVQNSAGSKSSETSQETSNKESKSWFETARTLVPEFCLTDDVTWWIEKFKALSARLPEEKKLELFQIKVAKNNWDWFLTNQKEAEKDGTAQSSAKWLESLQNRFETTREQRRNAILQRKQAENEEPEVFVAAIKRLCLQYDAHISDDDVLNFIRDNVHAKYRQSFFCLTSQAATVANPAKVLQTVMKSYGDESGQDQTKSVESGRQEARLFMASKSDDTSRSRPKPSFPKCRHCGRTNHTEDKCFRRNKQQSGQQERHVRFRGRDDRRFDGECFNCHTKGHRAADCRKRRNQPNSSERFNRSAERDRTNKRARSRSPTPHQSGNGSGGPA